MATIDNQVIYDLVNDGKPISLFSADVRLKMVGLGLVKNTETHGNFNSLWTLTKKGLKFFQTKENHSG